jgi:hypothetical protein
MRRHPVLFWLGALFFLRHMMRRGYWGYGGYGPYRRHHHHHRGFDYL